MRLRLTERTAHELRFRPDGPARQIAWDSEVSGFGVRIYCTSALRYVVRFRQDRREALRTIGTVGKIPLDEARQFARDVIAKSRRKSVLGMTAPTVTVSELSRDYLELYARPHKRTWRDDARRLRRVILPMLGAQRLAEVSTLDVVRLHREVSERAGPFEGNRCVELLSSMFARAIDWQLASHNPCIGLRHNREASRERFLTSDEITRLLDVLKAEPNQLAVAAIRLLLLTGLRKSELLSLEWQHIDLERRELHIERTKNGRAHTLPLSTLALRALETIPRDGSPYVFPSGKTHLRDIQRPWRRIRAAAQLEDVRLHDMRRTTGSLLALNGASLPLIGKILNHRSPSATTVYARFALEPQRDALEQLAQQFEEGETYGSNGNRAEGLPANAEAPKTEATGTA